VPAPSSSVVATGWRQWGQTNPVAVFTGRTSGRYGHVGTSQGTSGPEQPSCIAGLSGCSSQIQPSLHFPQVRLGFDISFAGCYRPFFAFLAAQYAFIRFDTSAFCAADISLRRRRLLPALAIDAVGAAVSRFRSGKAL